MLLFCLLWLPLCYLLWAGVKPPVPEQSKTRFFERISALGVGLIAGIVRFFFVSFWTASGLGLSRLISACFDYVLIPVMMPLAACAAFIKIRRLFFKINEPPDWTGWTLLALIPPVLICSIRWGTEKNPANLVLVPVLLSVLAFSMHPLAMFYTIKQEFARAATCTALIFALSLVGSAIWWAFFASQTIIAWILLALLLLFPLLGTCILTHKKRRG
ncbi:MAG: hypothetical protein LBD22_01425 [Spirochaetaceae bacterium]|jgi:hypothetical protein|nr:hypothetical protein [Spirochaetaceae bacterium]